MPWPPGDLTALRQDGPKVQAAAQQLATLSTIPAADAAYLDAHGAAVQQAEAVDREPEALHRASRGDEPAGGCAFARVRCALAWM